MHTFKYDDVVIRFNEDLDGDVIISTGGAQAGLPVPARALIAFIADAVRKAEIAKLEAMGPEELLGLDEDCA